MRDVPVLVRLQAPKLDFDRLRSDGRDVRFVDQRGPAPVVLAHERQVFRNDANAANDVAVFWVKVPQMNPSTERDHVWMYFGSGDAADTSNASATFSAYSAAWHLDDAAPTPGQPLQLREARTNAPSLVASSALDTDPSVVERGLALSGNNSFAVLDDQALTDQLRRPPYGLDTSAGSFSLMLGPFDDGGTLRPVGNGAVVFFADGQPPLSQGFDNRSIHLHVVDTIGDPTRKGLGISLPTQPARPGRANPQFLAAAGGVLLPDRFSHVLVSWTGSGAQIFVNGTQVVGAAATIVPLGVDFIDLGTCQDLLDVLRAGIDELRVARTARDAAFARAESQSTQGLLVTAGARQARP